VLKKLCCTLACLGSFCFADTSFDDVYTLYTAKEYTKALKGFETLVKKHHDYDAAYILGYMYEHGQGCKVNKIKANTYYKLSSHGYYFQRKDDPSRDTTKEQKKLFESIEKADDETSYTIKQYTQSLYSFKAYDANYFLPVSYRYGGDYNPIGEHDIEAVEIEFQFSLKYDFASNLLRLHEIYAFAYTQRSFWQAYGESAYFRESNYNPEFLTTFPLGEKYFKAFRLSLSHQSNGRGGAQERSWNYIAGSLYLQTGYLFTELRVWKRLHDTIDYNPDLIKYMGHGHIRFLLPYKKHLFKLLVRNNFHGKGALEGSYSYPFSQDNDLFFYLKAFHGYGESLIDFDNNIDKIGFGFSISR
jgi:phospholipase A1